MTVIQMRARIVTAYPNSKNWKAKVKKMTDDQVIAIYHTLIRFGKIIAG